MKIATLTMVGSQLGAAFPRDMVRALGWVRGDKLAVYVKDGDVVFRNSSERSARFTREFRARPAQRIAADAR